MTKKAQAASRPAWESQAKALPLANVAQRLGVEETEINRLVVDGVLSVCVDAPTHFGLWRRSSGPWEEDNQCFRQFPGRYGRLSAQDARKCLAEGFVTVNTLNLEPASLEQYEEERRTVCTPLSSTAPDGIRIQASDLLVSQVEYERYMSVLARRLDDDKGRSTEAEPVVKPSHLLVIAVLLELLKAPVEHTRPQGRNQEAVMAEILEKFSLRGLSRRNLEDIFAAANKLKRSAE